ncbi:hypothetical protein H2198_006515 [Neophaeococcomyces mojaviensis]|uniref:Uncharacterized protein n=1 Tax=Neophaeococcomyces mojaviensis TaxID=3383035 RepID=A0ACC3A2J8_9EURO|nr:hypothetical protein H2198_006515 [Knufia sp. JES_112]
MKRAENSDLLGEGEGGTSSRARREKRARLDVPRSPSPRRSTLLFHGHMNGRSDGQNDTGSVCARERGLQQSKRQTYRPRAQSDPLRRTLEVRPAQLNVSQTISELSKKAAELSKKQQEHMLAAERLQQRLTRGEHSLGEQLRESLKIQRAIQERREQNRIDKQQLDAERAGSKSVADDLDKVLREMQTLSEQMAK